MDSEHLRLIRWLKIDGFKQANLWDGNLAPSSPGVYVIAIPVYGVVYAGKSVRLSGRLRPGHEVVKSLTDLGYWPWRYFKECDECQLDEAEKTLIREWQPILNCMHTNQSLPKVEILSVDDCGGVR